MTSDNAGRDIPGQDYREATCESDMKAYDMLPPALRQVLQNLAFNMSAEGVRDALALTGRQEIVMSEIAKAEAEAILASRGVE